MYNAKKLVRNYFKNQGNTGADTVPGSSNHFACVYKSEIIGEIRHREEELDGDNLNILEFDIGPIAINTGSEYNIMNFRKHICQELKDRGLNAELNTELGTRVMARQDPLTDRELISTIETNLKVFSRDFDKNNWVQYDSISISLEIYNARSVSP